MVQTDLNSFPSPHTLPLSRILANMVLKPKNYPLLPHTNTPKNRPWLSAAITYRVSPVGASLQRHPDIRAWTLDCIHNGEEHFTANKPFGRRKQALIKRILLLLLVIILCSIKYSGTWLWQSPAHRRGAETAGQLDFSSPSQSAARSSGKMTFLQNQLMNQTQIVKLAICFIKRIKRWQRHCVVLDGHLLNSEM